MIEVFIFDGFRLAWAKKTLITAFPLLQQIAGYYTRLFIEKRQTQPGCEVYRVCGIVGDKAIAGDVILMISIASFPFVPNGFG